jgi:uncharacterized protein YecE (DUF72 family)
MCSEADQPTGYAPPALDAWATRAQRWAGGGEPQDLPRVAAAESTAAAKRDVFVYFINGAKVRAPHAAMSLIDRLRGR